MKLTSSIVVISVQFCPKGKKGLSAFLGLNKIWQSFVGAIF